MKSVAVALALATTPPNYVELDAQNVVCAFDDGKWTHQLCLWNVGCEFSPYWWRRAVAPLRDVRTLQPIWNWVCL